MQLFETIKILNGETYNLNYHEARLNRSRKILWGCKDSIMLASLIKPPDSTNFYRCKVVYDQHIQSIEYYPYTIKPITSFKLAQGNLDYPHKYLDRSQIDALFNQRGTMDDIIILCNDMVTDTSKANIAVYDNGKWFTPRLPLLPGTTRQRLLDQGTIHEADITREQLLASNRIALMNAMIDFMVIENPLF